MTDLLDLQCFVTVYQTGSFTAAAKKLGVSKVAVAKRLEQFERKLKFRLFRRSTRKLAPTPDGEKLYAQALELLDQVQNFEKSLTKTSAIEGVVRITCSSSLAVSFVAASLLRLQEQQPGLKFELISTDSVLDLIENNIDLAIRMGEITSASMVGRKIGENDLLLVASPEYLRRNTSIKKLSDLKKHKVFWMDYHREVRLKSGQKLSEIAGEPVMTRGEGVLIRELGLQGQGIVLRSRWSVRKDLDEGTLVPVLEDFPITSMGGVWLLSSTGRLQSPRVRKVFDHLFEESKAVFHSAT